MILLLLADGTRELYFFQLKQLQKQMSQLKKDSQKIILSLRSLPLKERILKVDALNKPV
jgi:hypothetical protein